MLYLCGSASKIWSVLRERNPYIGYFKSETAELSAKSFVITCKKTLMDKEKIIYF